MNNRMQNRFSIFLLMLMINISRLGAGLFSYAILTYYVTLHGELWRGSVILGLYYITKVFFAPTAGTIVDWSKNKLRMLLVNEIGGMLIYVAMLTLNIDSLYAFAVMCAMFVLEIFFNRISIAAIDNIVREYGDRHDYTGRLVAFNVTSDQAIGIMAPVIGPILLQFTTIKGIMLVNIMSFIPAISIICYYIVRYRSTEAAGKGQNIFNNGSWDIKTALFSGYINSKTIFENINIRNTVVTVVMLNAMWAIIPLFLSSLASGRESAESYFSGCMASFNAGAVIIGILVARGVINLSNKWSNILWKYGLFTSAVSIAALLGFTSLSIPIFAIVGAFGGWLGITLESKLIQVAPAGQVGGVNNTVSSLGSIAAPLWIFLFTYVSGKAGSISSCILLSTISLLVILTASCIHSFNAFEKIRRIPCQIQTIKGG